MADFRNGSHDPAGLFGDLVGNVPDDHGIVDETDLSVTDGSAETADDISFLQIFDAGDDFFFGYAELSGDISERRRRQRDAVLREENEFPVFFGKLVHLQ